MEEKTFAYRAGQQAGSALLTPGPALAACFDESLAERSRMRAPLAARLRECEHRNAFLAGQLEAVEQRLAAVRTDHDDLQAAAAQHPARFSWKRGALYLATAVVVLGAEFALLTQILAEVLQLSSFAKGEDGSVLGPAAILFSGEWDKIHPVLELFLATLGVLGLTVALKAARDLKSPSRTEAPSPEKWYSLSKLVLILVGTAIVLIAGARLVLDFGVFGDVAAVRPSEEYVARVVTLVIGLACPVAGLLLFTFGIDALSGTWRLRSRGKKLLALEKSADELRSRKVEGDILEQRAQSDLSAVASGDDRIQQTRITNEFRQGFAAGFDEVLNHAATPGGHRRIRNLIAAANVSGTPG